MLTCEANANMDAAVNAVWQVLSEVEAWPT
jgi:hypothetical protein